MINPVARERPRQLTTNDQDVRHHPQTTMKLEGTSRRLIIAANERPSGPGTSPAW